MDLSPWGFFVNFQPLGIRLGRLVTFVVPGSNALGSALAYLEKAAVFKKKNGEKHPSFGGSKC